MVSLFHRILIRVLRLFPDAQRAWFWHKMAAFKLMGITLPLGIFLKHTHYDYDYEATVLPYVAEHTTIPVPAVIDTVHLGNKHFLIVMSKIPGKDLSSTFRDMTEEQTAHVVRQLSSLLAQIRAIPPPQPGVCALGGGVIRDNRLSFNMVPWGPFASVPEFHDYMVMRSMLRLGECEHPEEVLSVIRKSHSKAHRVCFTHGDFHPGNIMVDDDFNVTGLVDWEMSAWMPEYWEYTRALYLPYCKSKKGKWYEIMTRIFPQVKAQQLTTNLLPILASAGLTPASHPLLALTRLHHGLLIAALPAPPTQDALDACIRTAAQYSAALQTVTLLPRGHPVRAVALGELGLLLAWTSPFPLLPRKRAGGSRHRAAGGEEPGREVRNALVRLESEIGAWTVGIRNALQDAVAERAAK